MTLGWESSVVRDVGAGTFPDRDAGVASAGDPRDASFLQRAREADARLKAWRPHPLRVARRAWRFVRYAPSDPRASAPIRPWSVEERMRRVGVAMSLVGFGLPILAHVLLPTALFSDESAYTWMGFAGTAAYILSRVEKFVTWLDWRAWSVDA